MFKSTPYNRETLGKDLRNDFAPLVYKATLQPVSSFLNALRAPGPYWTAKGVGARLAGRPIYRARSLVPEPWCPSSTSVAFITLSLKRPGNRLYEEIDDPIDPSELEQRAIHIPGTDEFVDLPPRSRRVPSTSVSAIRHGRVAFNTKKDGALEPPNICRVPYHPWQFMGAKLGARFKG